MPFYYNKSKNNSEVLFCWLSPHNCTIWHLKYFFYGVTQSPTRKNKWQNKQADVWGFHHNIFLFPGVWLFSQTFPEPFQFLDMFSEQLVILITMYWCQVQQCHLSTPTLCFHVHVLCKDCISLFSINSTSWAHAQLIMKSSLPPSKSQWVTDWQYKIYPVCFPIYGLYIHDKAEDMLRDKIKHQILWGAETVKISFPASLSCHAQVSEGK